jgi:hypothetical protein
LFDLADVAGAAVEAAGNVGVCGPAGAPFQDPTLDRPQRVPCRLDAGAGHPRVSHHSIDEVRSAPESASDLDVIDAIGNEAQDATFDRPQRLVVIHVLVSSVRGSP